MPAAAADEASWRLTACYLFHQTYGSLDFRAKTPQMLAKDPFRTLLGRISGAAVKMSDFDSKKAACPDCQVSRGLGVAYRLEESQSKAMSSFRCRGGGGCSIGHTRDAQKMLPSWRHWRWERKKIIRMGESPNRITTNQSPYVL